MADASETIAVKLGGKHFLASKADLMDGHLKIVGEAPAPLPSPHLTTPLPDQFQPKPAVLPKHTPKDPSVPGSVRLIDGDTFDYGGKRYRLFGVDAPETQEHVWVQDDAKGTFQDETGHRFQMVSGRDAAKRLMAFMQGKKVEVAPIEGLMSKGQKGRDRGIARLKIDGLDAGQWLVNEGLAYPVPTFSGTEYDEGFTKAKKARKGYWSRGEGYYEDPYRWRKERRKAR